MPYYVIRETIAVFVFAVVFVFGPLLLLLTIRSVIVR